MKKIICVLLILLLSGTGSLETYAAYTADNAAKLSEQDETGGEEGTGGDTEQNPTEPPGGDSGNNSPESPDDSNNPSGTPDDNTGNNPPVSTEKAIRVLLVGNSFTRYKPLNITYSVEKPLEELAAGAGHNLDVKTLSHSSAYLSYYAGMNSTYISYHRELMQLLLDGNWDYIVFQEQSKAPVEQFDTQTYPAVERLLKMVKMYQPQATPLLYMTHGYSDGSLTKVNGVSMMLTSGELELYLAAAYRSLETKLGIEVVPVGMHYNRVHIMYPSIRMVGTDLKHPSYAGYYLAACSFYYRIFGTIPDPRKASLTNCNITEQELLILASMPPGSIRMSEKSISLKVNGTGKVTALSGTSGISSVTYKSLNSNVVSVNPVTGVIKANQGGSTTVAAVTPDGLQAFCDVIVRIPLSFPREWYLAGKGDKIQINPLTNSENLKWTSGKKTVATVNATTGVVEAKATGRALITVRNAEDATDSASYYLYVTCDTPTGLKAASVDCSVETSAYGSIKLTWNAVTGASNYGIYRSTKKNGSYTLIGTSKQPVYTDTTATVNTCYYYKVTAKNSYQYCTSQLSTCVRGIILKAPTLKGSITKKGYAKLKWNKNSKASGYMIYASTKKDSGYKRIVKLTSASRKTYTDQYLKKKKRHYYRIRAYKVLDGKIFYGMRSRTLEIPYTTKK